MEVFFIFLLVTSIAWSCLCTAIILKNEETINYLMNLNKELEKENKELNDKINILLSFDSSNDSSEIDWRENNE